MIDGFNSAVDIRQDFIDLVSHQINIALIRVDSILERLHQTIHMFRRVFHIGTHISERFLNHWIAGNLVNRIHQRLHMFERVGHAGKHRIHTNLVETDDMIAVFVKTNTVINRRDVDEFFTHNAGTRNRCSRPDRNSRFRIDFHRDSNTDAFISNHFDSTNRHAGKSDFGFRLESNNLMKTNVQSIIRVSCERQLNISQSRIRSSEEHHASNSKRTDFCFECRHSTPPSKKTTLI